MISDYLLLPKKKMKVASPRPKICCEICGNAKHAVLHYHHIIPRRDPRCHGGNNNLAILCANCHSLVHTGEIIIIGVYQTTGGQQLMWFKKGEDPPIPQEFWIIQDNTLVITVSSDNGDLPDKNY